MAQNVDLKRLLATGKHLGESGRSQARQLGTDLVEQGRQASEQISAVVDELVSRGSRERLEELRETIRDEVQQLRTLGSEMKDLLAQQSDLAADRIAAAVEELGGQRRALDEQLRELDERLRETVRDEVQHHLSTFGAAISADLDTLGRVIRDDLTTLQGRLERVAGSPDIARESAQDNDRRLDGARSAEDGGDDHDRHEAATEGSPPHEGAAVTDPPTT